jgi:hypothetical protein
MLRHLEIIIMLEDHHSFVTTWMNLEQMILVNKLYTERQSISNKYNKWMLRFDGAGYNITSKFNLHDAY